MSNTEGDWHRNKIKFLAESASNAADRKSIKITQTPKINEVVYLWFYLLRSRGLPTSGTIIKEKAEILSKKFPNENNVFKASECWLHR